MQLLQEIRILCTFTVAAVCMIVMTAEYILHCKDLSLVRELTYRPTFLVPINLINRETQL